jgi:DNA-directed RNA polymerase subunit RPC12/RpoP
MVEFRRLHGAVYVLENTKARRVKVGMTINDVFDRLRDVNRMWSSMKVACQICGARRLASKNGLMPQHVVSGRDCPGGNELPLERDVLIAESHLERLKLVLHELSVSEKGSAVRKLKNLEKRMELYRDYRQPVGKWQFSTAFYTDCAEQVELLSHEILAESLDRQASFGEVFCCSVSEATEAVESALSRLGLFQSARKEIGADNTSEEYGKCIICGKNLTKRGACPDCAQRLSQVQQDT